MRARATDEERELAPPHYPAPREHYPRAADSTAVGMSSPEHFPETDAPLPPPPPPPPSYQPQRARVREALSERAQPVPDDARSVPHPSSSEDAAVLSSTTSSLEDVVVSGGAIAVGGFPVHPRQQERTGSAHRAVFEALARLLPVLPPTEEGEEERGGVGGRLEAAGGAGRMKEAALRCGSQCQGYIRSLQQGVQVPEKKKFLIAWRCYALFVSFFKNRNRGKLGDGSMVHRRFSSERGNNKRVSARSQQQEMPRKNERCLETRFACERVAMFGSTLTMATIPGAGAPMRACISSPEYVYINGTIFIREPNAQLIR